MYLSENCEKVFSKVFKGYDAFEVDNYIKELKSEILTLNTKISKLQEEIRKYQEQDSTIKDVLINAQQMASKTKLMAESQADEILRNSKLQAKKIIDCALDELVEYKENIFKIFFGCEHRLKAIIDSSYSKYRYHMEQIEKEVSEEVEKLILRYNRDFDKSFPLKEAATVDEAKPACDVSELWKVKEDFFLVGKKTESPLSDQDGTVILEKGTTITPKVIDSVIEKGLYGELILSLQVD